MTSQHGMALRRLVAAVVTALVASLLGSSPAAAQAGVYGDVPDDVYYSMPVTDLASQGVFAGTECEEGFCPGVPLDRKTMAVWTVRVLDGADPAAVSESRFADVDAAGFFAPFIERMAELGVTGGCGDGSRFCPDRTVTRAQMAVFLSQAFNLPDGPDPGFTDVPADAWYAAAVAKLAGSDITGGCGDGSVFCPGRTTTRAQMATFLHKALHREGAEAPVQVPTSGEAAVVVSGASFIAEFDTVTVEGSSGTLSGAARLSLSETRVGAGRTAEGEELTAAPIAMSITGAEIVEPITLRVEVDTESLTPTDVVPVWWSSALGAWVPLDAQDIVIADGEIIVRSTFADARPVNDAAESAVTLFAGSGGLDSTPDRADPTLAGPGLVVWGIIVFVGGIVGAGVVAITNEKFRDVASRFFGLRRDEPECDGSPLPAWVRDLSDSDDQASSPDRARLHTCGERAGDELRVKVVNNRNYGIELSAAEGDYPVSIPGGANPANVLELAIKKGAERLIGDSYLWPLSYSEFSLPPQQSDWSGRWHPTGKTIVADVFRFGLDLLRVALPGTALTDNARFVDCVVDVIERVAEIIKGLSSLAEIWLGVVGQAANCFESMKSDTSFIGGKLSENARDGLGQVADSFKRPSAVTHLINAGISGIKWGLTVADAIKDAQQDEAWISIDVDGTVADAVPPPSGPARYAEPFSIVAAGALHTCAVGSDGTVACWGNNEHGQTNAPSGSFDAVSSGRYHSCGLRTNGALACWGLNDREQAIPPTGENFRGVTSGWSHSCALRDDGIVVCWGDNGHGQTEKHGGRFIAAAAGGNQSCGVRVSGSVVCWGDTAAQLPSRIVYSRFNAVSSGTAHSCGLRTDRTIRCWSGDLFAEERGITEEPAGEFTAISAHGEATCGLRSNGDITCWGRHLEGEVEGPFTSVTLGLFHMCATRPDGTVECRGENDYGQTDIPPRLADPQSEEADDEQQETELPVDDVSTAQAGVVSAGWGHSCAVRTDNTITCWGDNNYGESLAPAGSYKAVSAGTAHSCGLRTDNTITCWGRNDDGESLAPAGSYKAVSAGGAYSCGLRTDNTITCWGATGSGQTDAPSGPHKALSAGAAHSCALRIDNTITCWGYDYAGRTDAPAGSYKAVSAGSNHSCGLRTDDTITCWGWNYAGQTDAPTGTYQAVSAGGPFSCALKADNTITCWGDNYAGQTDAPTGTHQAVSASDSHSCALKADNTITCWGDNYAGQTDAPTGRFGP